MFSCLTKYVLGVRTPVQCLYFFAVLIICCLCNHRIPNPSDLANLISPPLTTGVFMFGVFEFDSTRLAAFSVGLS